MQPQNSSNSFQEVMIKRDTLDSMVNSELFHSQPKVVLLSTKLMSSMIMSERIQVPQLQFHYSQLLKILLQDNLTQILCLENSVEMTTNSPQNTLSVVGINGLMDQTSMLGTIYSEFHLRIHQLINSLETEHSLLGQDLVIYMSQHIHTPT